MTSDPRSLDPFDLADVIREHSADTVIPYIDELERQFLRAWANLAFERAAFAHKAAEANELKRQAWDVVNMLRQSYPELLTDDDWDEVPSLIEALEANDV